MRYRKCAAGCRLYESTKVPGDENTGQATLLVGASESCLSGAVLCLLVFPDGILVGSSLLAEVRLPTLGLFSVCLGRAQEFSPSA